MKKRLLSLLLVLTMVLGMIPVSVSAETLPFTVTVDGQAMTQITESTLSWVDWSGIAVDVTCYTVAVPKGSAEATLNFEEEMQWSYYDSMGGYIGDGDTSWTPDTTHTVAVQDSNDDGELDGISVQDPSAFSTAYYILFVYEETQEPACLGICEDAPATARVSAGGLYKLNMQTIFTDSEDHALTYSYTITPKVENEHTKLVGEEFCFTSQDLGDYEVILSAECSGGEKTEHQLMLTVKEASQGLPIQYGYDETDKSTVTVHVNISSDGMPLGLEDGTVLAALDVTVPYFDLGLYGLEEYNRYGTENGKGPYVNDIVIKRPTGLHLYIYLLERYYMGLPEEQCCIGTSGVLDYAEEKDILLMDGQVAYSTGVHKALTYSGGATSIFMNEFWGHDCNIMYYRNHCYPYMSPGWGSTSDYILLSDGDGWDVAMFTDWGFYHGGYFASFTEDVYEVSEGGSELTVSTRQWGTSAEAEDFVDVSGSEGLSVTLYDSQWQEVMSLRYDSENGNTITFNVPEDDGTYYLLATDPNAGTDRAKIAPAVAKVIVGGSNGGEDGAEVSRILLDSYSESLWTGGEITLTATVLPAEATDWTILWTSSDETVATVDQTGKVTAVGEGIATITAAIGDVKVSCEIMAQRYNTAPSVASGAASHVKVKTNESHIVDVAAMFTDAQNDALTYTVSLCVATALTGTWSYRYTELNAVPVADGKCTVSIPKIGIYALKITANDGKLSTEHYYQLTVVNNDAGVIRLADGVVMDLYNVVAVAYSTEFVEDFNISYKGTYDTTIHNIVLSGNTISGTPLRMMDITLADNCFWGQYSASGKDAHFQTRADIGVFARGTDNKTTAHFLKFYTECQTHTDADSNQVCDKCTMSLGTPGQFALLAVNADGYVIEPGYVTYAAGDTLKDALMTSGHVFEGIDSGFISSIDGVVDNFSLYYDGGKFDLNAPASEVTAVWFTANSAQGYRDDLLNLAALLAVYSTDDSGVKNYAGARQAYEAAYQDFYQTGNAAKLYKDLKDAMDLFDAFGSADTVPVTLNITHGEGKLTTGLAVFTSEFGTIHRFTDFTSVQLAPATYSFDISDGSYRHVRGSVTVSDGTVITATVPTGTWITSLLLGSESGYDIADAFPMQNITESSATYLMPDSLGSNIYPYAVPAEGVDPAACKLFFRGYSYYRTWQTTTAVVTATYTGLQKNSMEGVTGVFEAVLTDGDYEQFQTFTVTIVRVPTLKELSASFAGTGLELDFAPGISGYAATVTSDTVDISAAALCDGVTITANGIPVPANIKLSDCPVNPDGSYLVRVELTADNGQTNAYTLDVTKVEAVEVTVNRDDHVKVDIINAAGTVIAPVGGDEGVDIYRLVPSESYTWLSTVDIYYHATASFTASAGLTVDAATPKAEDWATNIAARISSAASSELTADSAFTPADHTYTYQLESNSTTLRLLAASRNTATYTVTVYYTSHNNSTYSTLGGTNGPKDYATAITSNTSYKNLTNVAAAGGWGNQLRVEYKQTATENGVTFYQDYFVDVVRSMTLNSLTAADNKGTSLVLTQEDASTGFHKQVYNYRISMASGASSLELTFRPLSSYRYDSDYTVTVANGSWSQSIVYSEEVQPKDLQTVTVPLTGTVDDETVTVTVCHGDETSVAQTYSIAVNKLPPIATTFAVTPSNAVIFLTEDATGTRIAPEADGSFILNTEASYTYVITAGGYVTKTGSFVAGQDNASITVSLTAAAASNLKDISISGDWLQFRADGNNNGVVGYKTPIKAEDAVLQWANKIGEGYDSGATGCPIIVGGYLYTYAGKSIVKVNKDTGEVVASGAMAASSSFAINSPTYAEGMIFVALSGGKVQAFNAETLESLWLFTDSLGGQPNCPIVYCDGNVYTGFWNSETKDANFVCLNITDEDPSNALETKVATWSYTHNGFYWAGAYANQDFVLIGTDDGDSGYTKGLASILSLDAKTGLLIDEKKLTNVGDQRSSICYDADTDAYYFTTKGGDFYQIKTEEDGSFKANSLRRLHLDNGADSEAAPPMSTSTPVIYNGRAYIGVSGTGQFSAYSGHNMTVIDLETFSIAYTVATQGYPQTSGLLSTAYEDTDGYVYVYFIDNYTPGKLRVIRDKKGITEVDHSYTTLETVTVNGVSQTIETGYVLFTPSGSEAQYAICSPIADAEGNLYFKNDSAYMMRLSSRITGLEITAQPEKLIYEPGMTFNGTGMTVTAHYANGLSKDITDCVIYTTDPLTAEDTEITLFFDPDKLFEKEDTAEGGFWKWYQDQDGKAGQTYYLPTGTVTIDLRPEHTPNEGVQTKTPTCTEDGELSYTCEICGQVFSTEEIPATGHSFENGTCGVCGEADPDYVKPIVQPVLNLSAPTLEFKDMIKVVAFFTAENIDNVVEMGMVTYTEQVDVIDINTAAHVIPGAEYEASSGRYYASSQGINAKYLADTVYLACYAKLSDGSYVYTKLAPYSPITYATNQLKNSANTQLKQLVAAMLNYGAAAQTYFNYNVENLANASLTEEQLVLPDAYRDDMVSTVPTADAAKQGIFANNKGFSLRKPAVSFEGAFSINYFFTPAYTPVDGITVYYWTEADFDAVEELTVENATGTIVMDGEGTSQYRGDITGIAAKNISQAVYVAAVYSDGTTNWTSGVLGYSIGAYCGSQATKGGTIADLAMATAVYGYHAKQYFG